MFLYMPSSIRHKMEVKFYGTIYDIFTAKFQTDYYTFSRHALSLWTQSMATNITYH